MRGVGGAFEAVALALRPVHRFTPIVTRFSVDYVCQDVTYRSDKLSRDLGYEPVYTEAEALERTTAWFRRNWPQPER